MLWAVRQGKEIARPDLVFASSTPLTVGEVGRKIAAYHRVPFVFEVRDLWPEVPIAMGALKNPLLRFSAMRMTQRIYDAADHIVALSPGMKEGILHWGIPAEKISVIPNCSDTTLFGQQCPSEREAERTRRGWNGKLMCIYPGSLGVSNGLDYLINCAKVLDQHGVEDIHLAIVGDGADAAAGSYPHARRTPFAPSPCIPRCPSGRCPPCLRQATWGSSPSCPSRIWRPIRRISSSIFWLPACRW